MDLTRTTGTWIILAALLLGAFGLLPSQVAALPDDKLNDPGYWETQTTHESRCFKHELSDLLSNDHGTSDGLAVTLVPFDPDWFGDHWELLVVKAGTGNEVYDHPTAGVPYPAFEGKGVSHWIVCKGDGTTTTTQATTTSSTSSTSTSTTTTTTASTTTTENSTTTTETTVPSTTTTDPTTTTNTPTSTSTSVPESITDPLPTITLPFTGIDDIGLYAGYAIALLSAGGLLILMAKRR